MAFSISLPCSFKLALTVALLFFFSFSPKSVGLFSARRDRGEKEMKYLEKAETERESYVEDEKKMVIGSRPPGCENKCKSCRPCMAAVVVPVHRMKASTREEEDSYYLLSWKCRCGNKIYQP